MKTPLPALALRTTRVRLLASTYLDAMTCGPAGGPPDEHGSRLHLHAPLWDLGSYDELDQLAAHAPAEFRSAYLDRQFKDHPVRDLDALILVTRRMPVCIYVPAEVSEYAGYLPGDAAAWRMPEREQRRRQDRRPALRV